MSHGPEQAEPVAFKRLVSLSGLRLLSRCGQLEPYYLDHPIPSPSPTTMSSQHHSSSPNLVGGHYRVGRKIGEGSFGVIFEGLLSFLQLFPSFSPSELFFSRQGRTFSTHRPSPSSLLVPIRPGARSCCRSPSSYNHVQEPRKAEAPQLRDECRSYRILAGCRQSNPLPPRRTPYPSGF